MTADGLSQACRVPRANSRSAGSVSLGLRSEERPRYPALCGFSAPPACRGAAGVSEWGGGVYLLDIEPQLSSLYQPRSFVWLLRLTFVLLLENSSY